MSMDCTHRPRWDIFAHLAGPAEARHLVPWLPLLVVACTAHNTAMDPQARYRQMVGRSETELTQTFGQPTRRENIGGHDFLTYEHSDVWPGHGGGQPARLDRHESDTVAFECRATFVVVAGMVSTYSLSGSGC
jgi:hypothetical protein